MRQRFVIAGVCAVAFLLFFFLVPVIQMNVMPCHISGNGYSSLSYHIFNLGLAYITNPNSKVYVGPIPQSQILCW